jgi:hypothetical protein
MIEEELDASIFYPDRTKGFSGTLIHSYQTSWHHIQEGSNLNKKVTSYKMQEVPTMITVIHRGLVKVHVMLICYVCWYETEIWSMILPVFDVEKCTNKCMCKPWCEGQLSGCKSVRVC